jgi:multiple sugar transport system permease protein
VVLVFLSPWIIGFCLFTAGPMLLSFYYSFTHYDLLNAPRWIGLDNYRYMFGHLTLNGRSNQGDPFFWQAVRNTMWIIVFGVPLRIVVAMATAMLLTRPKRGVNVYRTLFFMPSLAPTVAATLVFVYLLNPTTGPVAQGLGKLGVSAPLWFYDSTWAKPALLVLGLWGVGDAIVIFLAGLLNVPRELYEAIAIEGANAWQRFRYVTLPMLTPVIFFSLVIGVIYGFQYFDQAYVASTTTNSEVGAPQGSLLFYTVWLYQQAFTYFNMGYASAMAWMLFLITMVFTAILLVTSKRWVHYGGGFS